MPPQKDRSILDILVASSPAFIFVLVVIFLVYKYVDPAPPKHIVISTGDGEGDYQTYAKLYKDIIKEDGVDLEIRPSKGSWDNLNRLQDPNSDVDAGFVEDGLGTTEKQPDVSSLGSLYYEPIWVFYKGKTEIKRFAQFLGKRISMGEKGGGTHSIAKRIFKATGIDEKNTTFIDHNPVDEAEALRKGEIDVAIFMAAPDDKLITDLIKDKSIRLMSAEQAEAISRQFPYLHHLVLPRGVIDLKESLPAQDVDLVSPTATLIVKDSLHSALMYLLLKAASQVHGDPGILEKKNEFPIDKDYVFPLTDEAKAFYKSGTPFWQRYLPFWLATFVERFIVLVIPVMALIIPVVKLVPRILDWRLKSRFYQRYGELKYIEELIDTKSGEKNYEGYLHQLDGIEERVNRMRFPLDFSDQIYGLREHIHFVRERLDRLLKK